MRRLCTGVPEPCRQYGVKESTMDEQTVTEKQTVTVEVYDFPAQTACFSGG
jgi:hypothetical protein